MNERYARSYSVLGLSPGSSWSEIRDAYKYLIKKWHPDHFQQDNKNRRTAEEKTMEITRAYKALADYHRKHGSTPPATTPAPAKAAEAKVASKPASRPAATTATETHADHAAPSQAEAVHWKTLFALAAFSLLFYFWFLDAPVDPDLMTGAPESGAAADLHPSEPGDNTTPHRVEQRFTIGSKPGEVYAAQGIPTNTENGIWHYGKSRVYFINGGVSRWEIHPENPLNIDSSLDVASDKNGKDFIRPGSTRDEVRALQGTPWTQTEREWTYGSSRIFFSGDVVTGWKESAMNPLKIQR